MSERKEQRRAAFRDAVYKAAGYRCQGPRCRVQATAATARDILDAHHITSRKVVVNEGYVRENGIALCVICHVHAECVEQGRGTHDGFEPANLYKVIGSSLEEALATALRLGPDGELGRRAAPR